MAITSANQLELLQTAEAVDLGDAKFLLGMGIHRNVHAGTII